MVRLYHVECCGGTAPTAVNSCLTALRSMDSVCCGHGVLSPALTGSILGVALIFGFFGLFCVGDVLAVVFGIVAVVLAFLPACIQFPRARGAKAMYFVVGGLAILSMIMKTFCLVREWVLNCDNLPHAPHLLPSIVHFGRPDCPHTLGSGWNCFHYPRLHRH